MELDSAQAILMTNAARVLTISMVHGRWQIAENERILAYGLTNVMIHNEIQQLIARGWTR